MSRSQLAALWICGAICFATPAAAELGLDEVLDTAREHFPLIEAVRAEALARGEDLRSARGAFDLRVGLTGDIRPEGFYENAAGDVLLEQDTTLWGSKLFAGYRYGQGDFPSYDGGRLTDESGEVRVGVEVPLLRDGSIDDARAGIRDARISLAQMEPEMLLQRVDVELGASVAYWEWLAAGQTLEIAERLLAVALERQEQLESRVAKGAEARIVLTDNRRLIVERSGKRRGAERDFQMASIRLSLYYRDASGQPIRAGRERLPERFPTERKPEDEAFVRDLELVEEHHPILRRFENERDRVLLEIEQARNRTLPSLDLRVELSRDFGGSNGGIDERGKFSSDSRSDTEVKALMSLRMPVQQRKARGRLAAAKLRLSRIANESRIAEERIIASALEAIERLKAAYEQTGLARENVELASMLRDAENRRLALGLSNLIDVNIREIQAATAETALVDAQRAFFRATAEYAARIASMP